MGHSQHGMVSIAKGHWTIEIRGFYLGLSAKDFADDDIHRARSDEDGVVMDMATETAGWLSSESARRGWVRSSLMLLRSH